MDKPKKHKERHRKLKGKTKPKKKPSGVERNGVPFSTEPDDLMTAEDKHLLQDVHDEEDESVVELNEDGEDLPLSEISSFIESLGLEKYKHLQTIGAEEMDEEESEDVDESSSNKNGKTKTQESNGSGVATKVEKPKKLSFKQVQEALKFLQTRMERKHLLMKVGEMWREEQARPFPELPPDNRLVSEAEALSQKLLEDEIALYSKHRENTKRSEARWLKTVLSSGTLPDKMAALTLLVQESPLHNLSCIENLVTMAGKKGRREAMLAVDTVRDLFLTGLLPDDRKLRAFNQQPLADLAKITEGNIDTRDKYLLMWHFENILKRKYSEFTKTLGEMLFDTLQATKEKALSTIHRLLANKPEQESVLLPMIVNKLGDPAVKSKATYLLIQLIDEHPNMKPVIVKEVQQLIYRQNVSPRAQYYAICYLNQLRLDADDGDLASELIQTYFFFFKTFLKKGEVDNKMMSALLTGVNRAYVYAEGNKQEIAEEIDAIYKIIPAVNFHTGVQALMLLFQVTDASTNAADRYYTCLYRKLSDPALKTSAKQAIFMNLLFKSLKRDLVDRRIKAFFKRILQVYSQLSPHIICGILILLSQILADKPGLIEKKHIAENVWSDDEEEKFVDIPAPDDDQIEREKGSEGSKALSSSVADEGLKNADGKGNGSKKDLKNETANGIETAAKSSSWVHRVNFGGSGKCANYDPFSRNPLYSRAEQDLVWELKQLSNHYHPSVRLYADTVIQGKPIDYDGDPMKDFTLIRFLDRFVYKNPKKDLEKNTSSVTRFKKKGVSGVRAIPVNSEEYLEAGEDGVPEDEKFFFRYFSERARRKAEEEIDKDSDAGSVGDDEFDNYLDQFEKDADMDEIGDLDLDFAGDKRKTKSNKAKTGTKQGEEDEIESDNEGDDDDDDEDDLDLEDEDLAAEFQQEMEGLGDDSDGEFEGSDDAFEGGWKEKDVEFSPDEDDELKMMMLGSGKGLKRKKGKKGEMMDDDDDFGDSFGEGPKKKKKRDKNDLTSLFASAEEFSHLLEEDTEGGKISLGGSGDLRNKDKAGQKQLKWESDRDRWMQDKFGKGGKGKKFKGKGKGGYSGQSAYKKGKSQSGGFKGKKNNFGKKRR